MSSNTLTFFGVVGALAFGSQVLVAWLDVLPFTWPVALFALAFATGSFTVLQLRRGRHRSNEGPR